MVVTERKPFSGRYLSNLVQEQISKNATAGNVGGIINSPIESYERFFKNILGDVGIVDFVKNRNKPVVIDLMSSPQALVSLFRKLPNHCQLGLSVSLPDTRTERQISQYLDLNVKYLIGDILSNKTWEKINDELNGRKADLIVERGLNGVSYILTECTSHAILMRKAWRILNEDGGMVLMDCPYHENIFDEWAEYLKGNNIDAVCGRNGPTPIIKLVKTPDSPKKLPFLPY